MAKTFVFIPAIILSMYGICEGLECYHCYTGSAAMYESKGIQFIPCDAANMTQSNTWICPAKAKCIYAVVDVASTRERQTWRTCSNVILEDPCDPNFLPPGVKMVKCTHCNTDRCNLSEGENGIEKNTFTFNINANVNLFIKQ